MTQEAVLERPTPTEIQTSALKNIFEQEIDKIGKDLNNLGGIKNDVNIPDKGEIFRKPQARSNLKKWEQEIAGLLSLINEGSPSEVRTYLKSQRGELENKIGQLKIGTRVITGSPIRNRDQEVAHLERKWGFLTKVEAHFATEMVTSGKIWV